jgi:hypothetical protein
MVQVGFPGARFFEGIIEEADGSRPSGRAGPHVRPVLARLLPEEAMAKNRSGISVDLDFTAAIIASFMKQEKGHCSFSARP